MSETVKHTPFPETPVWPPRSRSNGFEGARLIVERQLEGVPISPEESAFFEDRPRLIDFVYEATVGRHNGARSYDHKVVDEFAGMAISNPSEYTLSEINESLEAIIENNGDWERDIASYVKRRLPRSLEKIVEKQRVKSSPELMGSILKAISEGMDNGYILLGKVKDNSKGLEENIDFAYDSAIAALNSRDDDVERLFFELFNFENEIMRPNDDVAKALVMGVYSMDDTVLQKSLKIVQAHTLIKRIHFDNEDRDEGLSIAATGVLDELTGLKEKNVERFNRLSIYHGTSDLNGFIDKYSGSRLELPDEYQENLPFPYNLVITVDDLEASIQTRMRLEVLKGNVIPGENLTFHKKSDDRDAFERLQYDIDGGTGWRDYRIDIFRSGEANVLKGEYPEEVPMELFLPDFVDKISDSDLAQYVAMLRAQIINGMAYSVSPRGDKVKIEDDLLTEVGLASMLFSLGSERQQTKVTLNIHSSEVEIFLNREFVLTGSESRSLDIPDKTRHWWEALALSHLKNILCGSAEVSVDYDLEDGGYSSTSIDTDPSVAKSEHLSRRAHARRLQEGHRYTDEQRNKALDLINFDLKQFNLDRGVDVDDLKDGQRVYTWVFETEYEQTNNKPIVLRMPGAMREFETLITR